ncbi:MAG: alpha-amylase family glycosyl hydrolase [Paludibacter sp.]|nr:alpha-amylase family glycosyl hydrolase [Paludibacter sp.]
MKKNLLFIIFQFLIGFLSAQVVTTSPSIVVQQTGTAITVTFDDSYITALNGNAGPLYVHTGVITTASTSNSDWKNVITPWPNGTNSAQANTTANKLTQVGTTTKWTLTMSDINTYYSLTAGTIVTQLAFVVRTADGSLQSSNLYVPVYQPGLNVKLATPTTNTLVPLSTATTITGNASNGSQSCNISLYVGSTSTSNITGTTPIISGTGVNTLSTNYTFNTADNYYIIEQATSNGSTKTDTAYVCVTKPQVSLARPSGLKEGITINSDGSVTFCLSLVRGAPVNATSVVYLLGDFNNFKLDNKYMMNLQLENTTYGYNTNFYWLTVSGLDPTKEYAYQYYVDGLTATSAIRVGDPYCEKILDPNNDQYINQNNLIYPNLRTYPTQASGILSCFQINPTKYQWQTTNFTAPAQNKLMIYEMLFRDFTTQGSVQAAIQKLDYIKSLGMNAVELMPIMEFDGNNSWGYNPNFYFAPDKAYGTKSDYQQFVDECHKRGMAVILDIVFNHTWGLSPYCMIYWDAVNNRPLTTNPYYNAIAPHPYSVGNDLNHSRSFVRSWLKRALQFWLTEYKVDGFRFDLSKGFTQTQSTTATVGNYDASRISYIKEYSDAIKAVNPNGYPILEHFCNTDEEDTLANYHNTMLWRNMSGAYQQAAMGFSTNSDFTGMVGKNRVGYAESHDEERMAYKAVTYGQTALLDTTTAMKQLSVIAPFIFLNPGPRMMWQFGELGYSYSILYNGGNTSPKPVRWDYLNIPSRLALHDVYSKVINFRDQYSDLFSNPTSWNWQVTTTDWTNGRRIYLTNGSLNVVILGNFTGTGAITANPNFPKTGTWYELLSGNQLNVTNTSTPITMQLGDLLIYTDQQITLPTGLNNPVVQSSATVFPTVTSGFVYITSSGTVQTVNIYSLQGSLLKAVSNSTTVDFSKLTSGVYIMEVNTSAGRSIHKIIKQ